MPPAAPMAAFGGYTTAMEKESGWRRVLERPMTCSRLAPLGRPPTMSFSSEMWVEVQDAYMRQEGIWKDQIEGRGDKF